MAGNAWSGTTGDGPNPTWRKQDWAYQQLREWIITGELAAGAIIEQEHLATQLGISRIPLREALARLAAEGLISGRAHQKLAVTELSLADARDVYGGRSALESVLAAQAATRHSGVELQAVEAILEEQRRMLPSGSPDEFRLVDRRFHLAVYEMAQFPKTLNAASSLFAMSQRYVRIYLSDRGRSVTSYHEHAAILSAIKSHDSELAARLTREHVMGGLTSLESLYADLSRAEQADPS